MRSGRVRRCRPRRGSRSLRGWCGVPIRSRKSAIVDSVADAAPTLLDWTLPGVGTAEFERTVGGAAFRHDYSLPSFAPNATTARLRSSMLIPSAMSGSASQHCRLSQRNTASVQAARCLWLEVARRPRAGGAGDRGKALFGTTAGQGQRDLRRRRGLHHLEDQPPRGDRHPAEAVAAALAAARRDQPFAAASEVRGGSLAAGERGARPRLPARRR